MTLQMVYGFKSIYDGTTAGVSFIELRSIIIGI